MRARILQEPTHEGKPNPTRSPTTIAGGWVHAGSLVQGILANADAAERAGSKVANEEELCEGALP